MPCNFLEVVCLVVPSGVLYENGNLLWSSLILIDIWSSSLFNFYLIVMLLNLPAMESLRHIFHVTM